MVRCVIDPHCDGSSNTGFYRFISADKVIVYVAVIDHVSFVFVFLDSAVVTIVYPTYYHRVSSSAVFEYGFITQPQRPPVQ